MENIESGVIVPAITFFNKENHIISELNALLYRHIILNGANGILLFGTTGEGWFFSDKREEKLKLIKIALEISEDRVPIFAGIFANQVNEALDEMEELGKKFNDLRFVIGPPYQQKTTKEEIGPYFENIIGSTELKNPIYLYNNPLLFNDLDIEPQILNKVIDFPNLRGIQDSSEKINKYVSYLNFLSENFHIYCGKEGMFSTFLQVIPTELRKFCGIVPSFSNISNICSSLYIRAIEENTLEIIKIQEELNEYRKNIYDIQVKIGKQQRGLKTAFYSIYKDFISEDFNEIINVSPILERSLEDFSYDRIKAYVKYLTNLGWVDIFYLINNNLYEFKDFKEKFSHLLHLGKILRIKGPYGGKINALYRIKFKHEDIVFRSRISKAFHSEPIVKEKILFPFLDNSLHLEMPDLRKKVKEILVTKTGSYIFNNQKPPIIPVGDLIYYDETLQNFPDIYTLHKYIRGKPLFFLLNKYKSEKKILNTTKLRNLFTELGESLAKLHSIKFDGFHESIIKIGKKEKLSLQEVINHEIDYEIQEAKKNKLELVKPIKNYFKNNLSLIEGDFEPVLNHNDFQGQNIIINEGKASIQCKGLIDFDNWRIGIRSQDFVKFEFWTLNPLKESALTEAFYQGYTKYYGKQIDKDFKKKIELFSILWFLKVYNFEVNKNRKGEQLLFIDKRFPHKDEYLNEILKIIEL
jgi:4-hydroxy-tetrahydrodipicolinate synthase